MRAKKGLKGVITVYVSLVFLLVMSLLAALLETARVYGLRVRLQMASRGGLDSLFSMYSKPLFENYGILMLDESFGFDGPVADAFTNVIRENMKYDLDQNKGMLLGRTLQLFDLDFEDLTITKTIHAVDDGGVYFAQSAIDMMKYRVPASAFSSFTLILGMYENAEAAQQSIEEGGGAVESEDWNSYVTTAAPETLPVPESTAASAGNEPSGAASGEGSSESATGAAATQTEAPTTTEEATTIDYNAEADEAVDKSIIGVVKDVLKGNVLKIYGLKDAAISKGKRNIKESVSKKHNKDKVS